MFTEALAKQEIHPREKYSFISVRFTAYGRKKDAEEQKKALKL